MRGTRRTLLAEFAASPGTSLQPAVSVIAASAPPHQADVELRALCPAAVPISSGTVVPHEQPGADEAHQAGAANDKDRQNIGTAVSPE